MLNYYFGLPIQTGEEQFLQERKQIDPLIDKLNEAIRAQDKVKILELSEILVHDYALISNDKLRHYTQGKLAPCRHGILLQFVQNGYTNALRLLISEQLKKIENPVNIEIFLNWKSFMDEQNQFLSIAFASRNLNSIYTLLNNTTITPYWFQTLYPMTKATELGDLKLVNHIAHIQQTSKKPSLYDYYTKEEVAKPGSGWFNNTEKGIAEIQKLYASNFHEDILRAYKVACNSTHKEIAQYLLDLACAQPLTKLRGYDQMLFTAIAYGRFEHFKTLLDNETYLIFYNRQTLLSNACLHQNKQIIEYLLSKSSIFTPCSIAEAITSYSYHYKTIAFLLKEYKKEFKERLLELIFNTSSYYVQTAVLHIFPELLPTQFTRSSLCIESFAYRHCKTMGTKYPHLVDYESVATKLLNDAGIKDLHEYDNICFAARGVFAWKLVSKDWSQLRFSIPSLPTDVTNLITPLILGISDYNNILLIRNFCFDSRNEICDPSLRSKYTSRNVGWLEHLHSLQTIKENAIRNQ